LPRAGEARLGLVDEIQATFGGRYSNRFHAS
jgi:hypothetical protein